MTEDTYVKGSMLLNYVKIVRANPDRDWGKYLEDDDWQVINDKIFTSNRYSYGSFRRIGYAVFKEIAGSDFNLVRSFGRFNMKTLLELFQNAFLVPDDPRASVRKLTMTKGVFMSGDSTTRVLDQGEKWVRCIVMVPSEEDDPERAEAFCWQYAGHLEEVVEQAGGVSPKTEIKPSGSNFEILISWE